MQLLDDQHWHALPGGEVADLLETDPRRGLGQFSVKHRREQFGPNELTPSRGRGPLKRLLLQFHNPLIYILLAAGVVALALRDYVDAVVILGVVIANAVIGYVQEAKAVEAIQALSQTMTTTATVIREGEPQEVPATELVPGDLVTLQAGDKVPADLRVLRERELRVDESALTGESVPVDKEPGAVARDCPLAERTAMAYASSLVSNGTAAGLVTATGDGTEVGRISRLISEADELQTPLTRKIGQFSTVLLVLILALGVVTFAVGLLRGEDVAYMFKASIALAVAAIPEGLPAAVTITLAIGVNRMAQRRAIIRKLPAVETLGSTTVIGSDKTGTLTENQMTVRAAVTTAARYELTGTGYAPEGTLRRPDEGKFDGADAGAADAAAGAADDESGARELLAADAALGELLRAGLLCNDSSLAEDDGRWTVAGDPTEGALEVAARKAGLGRDEEAARLPRLDAIPFESQHQYMATLHGAESGAAKDDDADDAALADGSARIVYLKGAVEKVLERATGALGPDGDEVALDADAVRARVDELARQGLRVLAFARGRFGDERGELHHRDLEGLTFLGLQAMIDPPRPEALAAVAACRKAGITVKMITGDHAATAAAIACQIGIVDPGEAGHVGLECDADGRRAAAAAVTGAEMAKLQDGELIELAENTNVFARVTPEQKLRLVEALQSRGHVVAMTGDGVNDAPALKQADIGVAMGVSGTEVAKEAADMVLTDDNFASIEAAVEEGRGVFDNLIKFIAYALPTNVGQGAVLLLAVFLGLTLPILPLQILWINITTAVLLGLGLAFEPKEPGLMGRPPREPGSPILSRPVVERILLVGTILLAGAFVLFEVALAAGLSDAQSRTLAVNTFIAVQIFYLFNARTLTRSLFRVNPFSNPVVLAGVAAMVVLQLLFTYLPLMNTAFSTEPFPAVYWVPVVLVGIAGMLIVDAAAALQRRRAKHGMALGR